MKIYAFDVDETLDCSSGPISIESLVELRLAGHAVGLCGNWAAVVWHHPYDGWKYVSFLGPIGLDKPGHLAHMRRYIPADEYVMVGNDPSIKGSSQDASAAALAGWRFIREDDFAAGVR